MGDGKRKWIWQMARGEAAGLAELYDRYGEAIYRYCVRLCGNDTDAEDLTQDVFLAAWESAGRFAGRSSVRTWLYRIALFQWRGRQRRPLVSRMEEGAVLSSPDAAVCTLERLSLADALRVLPADLYDAFLLVKMEGLKYREAAEVLNVPQGTVQSRVHDAVHRLRALLAEEEALTNAV